MGWWWVILLECGVFSVACLSASYLTSAIKGFAYIAGYFWLWCGGWEYDQCWFWINLFRWGDDVRGFGVIFDGSIGFTVHVLFFSNVHVVSFHTIVNEKVIWVVYRIRGDGYYDSGWFEKTLYHSFKLLWHWGSGIRYERNLKWVRALTGYGCSYRNISLERWNIIPAKWNRQSLSELRQE